MDCGTNMVVSSFLTCLLKLFLWTTLIACHEASCAGKLEQYNLDNNSTFSQLRKEMLTQEIIDKMGLRDVRPEHVPNHQIPEEILNEFWEESKLEQAEDDEEESSKQVNKLMIHSKKAIRGHIRLSHVTTVLEGNISQLNFWIHQQQSGKAVRGKSLIEVHSIEENYKRPLLKTILHRKTSGWIKAHINDHDLWTVVTPEGHLKIDLLLTVTCSHCEVSMQEGHLPILDIVTETYIKKRRRRSLECTPTSTSCCLEPLWVDFTAFLGNLAKVIKFPDGFDIRHCRGKCDNYHAVSKEHASITTAVKTKNSEQLKLCCVPQKFKPLTAMVYNKKNELVKRVIHDLVVTECGCL